jgi:hypothetical protein
MNLADISKLAVANPFKQRYDNYQQTKNLLVSYSPKAMGFF